jgi:hypothetical protein
MAGELQLKFSRNRWKTRYVTMSDDHLHVYKSSADRSRREALPLTFASVKETAVPLTANKDKKHLHRFELWSGLRHVQVLYFAYHFLKRSEKNSKLKTLSFVVCNF